MDPTTLVTLASILGIISTTTFWSMNMTINHLTFPTLLLGDVPSPQTTKLSPRFLTPSMDDSQVALPFLNRQWQEVYWRGHRAGPTSAALGCAAFLLASWYSPTPVVRTLYGVAALMAVSVIPWTLVVMQADNDEMHRRGDAQRFRDSKEKQENAKGKDLMTLIQDWLFRNEVRASLAMVSTAIGIVALLL